MTLDQLTEQAMKLPIESRAQLAEQLVQSLDDDAVQKAWTIEAIRRRDEVRSGQVQPISGEQVQAEARRMVTAFQILPCQGI